MGPTLPDISPEHFDWLVEGRSANQRSTLKLYSIISAQETLLNGNVAFHAASQSLAGIAFSLWRAVFLSDTTGQFEDQTADVKRFLVSLISDNTVLYVTDKNARNWSFTYYLDNAVHRLRALAASSLALVDIKKLDDPVAAEKDKWRQAQALLDEAISRLGHACNAMAPA